MEAAPQRTGILVLALWLHGDEVVGRLTAIRDLAEPAGPAQVSTSVEAICAAVRSFVEEFRDGAVTPP